MPWCTFRSPARISWVASQTLASPSRFPKRSIFLEVSRSPSTAIQVAAARTKAAARCLLVFEEQRLCPSVKTTRVHRRRCSPDMAPSICSSPAADLSA